MPDQGAGEGKPERSRFHGDVPQHAAARSHAWPRRVGVVPLRADCFQDRVVADELAAAVDATGAVVVTQVLSGLGGVGKTQLAAQYAERLWADDRVDLLVWITAGSREAIVSGYADAAVEVAGAEAGDAERAARKLLAWLAETPRRWLVVLDDVRDPADLRGLWPPRYGSGRVVVTTRRRDAALSGAGRRVVDVGLFSPDEAVAYLDSKLADHPQQSVGAPELAEDLGFLPLALAQAAAYMTDRNLTCVDYRARLADRRRRLHDLVPDASGLPDDHQATVAAAWSMSIELADQLAPVGLARPLLEFASMLDPNGIPARVFTSSAVLAYLADSRDTEAVVADEARDALHCLHRLSLVTIDVDSPHRTVRAHSLVQRATRERFAESKLAKVAGSAADALLEVWPRVERDPGVGQALRANTEALHTHAAARLWHPDCHLVLFRAGRSFGETGLVAAAVTYFEDLHVVAAQMLGPNHLDTLATRHNVAYWRGEVGDVTGAVKALEEVLADELRVLGSDHPDTLITRGNLARWRGEAGDVAGAVNDFEGVLADQLRILGPDHRHTLITRHESAYWRGVVGDVTGAVKALEEVLADELRVLGSNHPDTLTSRRSLARWRGEAGDVVGAVSAFEGVLADQLRILGPDHPHTLITRHNLAYWRGEAGDIAGAVKALEAVLADRVRVLGPDHPHTLTARSNLAFWRQRAAAKPEADAS